jgi:hypothetical protein
LYGIASIAIVPHGEHITRRRDFALSGLQSHVKGHPAIWAVDMIHETNFRALLGDYGFANAIQLHAIEL